MIIRGGTIVTMDGSDRVIEQGAVAVKNGRIIEVGRTAEIDRKYAAREVANAAAKVVIPGLINGHTHVAESVRCAVLGRYASHLSA